MNWTTILLIFQREVRDQLRDRRMLFMMFVLPLLLYPLMGLSFLQLAQFLQEHPARVLIVGNPVLPDYPALLEQDEKGRALFAQEWLKEASHKAPFAVTPNTQREFLAKAANTPDLPEMPTPEEQTAIDEAIKQHAKELVDAEQIEVVLVFPPDFAQQLQDFQAWLLAHKRGENPGVKAPPLPSPRIYGNTAKAKSQLAQLRVYEVLNRWQTAIGQKHLNDSMVPIDVLRPLEIEAVELAGEQQKEAANWSKILPMMLILWALTGAFYPAIDLCAGEKERGTLETLLCSPAEREEIVTGKMLTVMLFSLLTSLFNLISVGATGLFVMGQLGDAQGLSKLGMPPAASLAWMALALIPVSILFSALCVALASYARSNKEGQYYLMPLMMTVLPLVLLPMNPAMDLTLGNALIPISGLMLLLRSLLEGEYARILPYLVPVLLVTATCCWIAVRWAVDQFNREDVLFRESERFDLRLWLRHLFLDKKETPSIGMALACVILMFIAKFFLEPVFATRLSPATLGTVPYFAAMVLCTQLLIMFLPAVVMALVFTTKPLKTLLLLPTRPLAVLLAVVLAVVLHPTSFVLGEMLQHLYPVSTQMQELLKGFESTYKQVPLWLAITLIAVVPAICEELAFRGFILSGLRHWGSRRRAIILSAVFFGFLHGMLQQSLNAVILGLVLGYIAVKANSLWPCIAFHLTNNALKLLHGEFATVEKAPDWFAWMLQPPLNAEPGSAMLFQPTIIVIGILAAGVILAWFGRLPLQRTREEALWDQINENRTLEMT
jgi:sodium transport system permease protein